MRLLVARCEVRYTGRLTAVLPEAVRLLIFNRFPVVQFPDRYRVELIERAQLQPDRPLVTRPGIPFSPAARYKRPHHHPGRSYEEQAPIPSPRHARGIRAGRSGGRSS
jgi:hypothetical protein